MKIDKVCGFATGFELDQAGFFDFTHLTDRQYDFVSDEDNHVAYAYNTEIRYRGPLFVYVSQYVEPSDFFYEKAFL